MASGSLYKDSDPLVTAASAQQADQMQGLRRTDLILDLLGRATETILPVRSGVRPVVHQMFDRWGNVISRSTLNGAGLVDVYEYDANNNVIRVTEPDGDGRQSSSSPVTEYYYDRLGRKVASRDQNGNVNLQVLDAAGHLTQEAHADGGVVKHYFNAFGEEIARRDAENSLITLRRDHLGHVVESSTDPVGAYTVGAGGVLAGGVQRIVSSIQYDEAGRIIARVNGAGEKTSYDIDLRGNTTAVHQPLGETDRSVYDAKGNRVAHTDANGATETWGYDANGRVQSHTDIGGATYAYAYDSAGQLVQQTNSRGQSIRTTYDAAGQVTQVRDYAEDKTTLYSYNLAGQHTREVTVQRGLLYQDNALAYDTRGQLARIDAVADGVSVLMEYDAAGNLVHQHEYDQTRSSGTLLEQVVIDGRGVTVARGIAERQSSTHDAWFAYDSMKRQIMAEGASNGNAADANNLTASQGRLATYDKNGNLTSVTYQGSQLIAQNGADGRTQYVVHQGQVKMYYRYDAAGRLTETAVGAVDGQGNALSASYATVVSQNYYDAAGRLVQSGAGSKLPAAYAQAAQSNPQTAYGTELTVKRYDADGRLLSERVTARTGELVQDTSYVGGYDAAGNILSYKIIDANGSVGTTNVTLVKQDGYKRTETVTTKVAPNGIAAVTSAAYTYDTSGYQVHIDTVSAKGAVASRDLFNDLSGHILQTKDGDQVVNRLVVDGRVYAAWIGKVATAPAPIMFRMMSLSTMSVASTSSTADDGGEAAITDLYWTLLKRAPDEGGLQFWMQKYAEGVTLDQIADAFKETPEYKDLQNSGGTGGGGDTGGSGGGTVPTGPTPTQQITDLYASVFGRAPDTGGLDYWTQQMANGTTLAQIEAALRASPEYKNLQGTAPDLGSIDEFGNRIVKYKPGDTLDSLAQQFYGDAKFWLLIAEQNVSSYGGIYSNDLSKLESIVIPDLSVVAKAGDRAEAYVDKLQSQGIAALANGSVVYSGRASGTVSAGAQDYVHEMAQAGIDSNAANVVRDIAMDSGRLQAAAFLVAHPNATDRELYESYMRGYNYEYDRGMSQLAQQAGDIYAGDRYNDFMSMETGVLYSDTYGSTVHLTDAMMDGKVNAAGQPYGENVVWSTSAHNYTAASNAGVAGGGAGDSFAGGGRAPEGALQWASSDDPDAAYARNYATGTAPDLTGLIQSATVVDSFTKSGGSGDGYNGEGLNAQDIRNSYGAEDSEWVGTSSDYLRSLAAGSSSFDNWTYTPSSLDNTDTLTQLFTVTFSDDNGNSGSDRLNGSASASDDGRPDSGSGGGTFADDVKARTKINPLLQQMALNNSIDPNIPRVDIYGTKLDSPSNLENLVSLGLDFIPGVSTVKSAVELVTGEDLVTGEETSRLLAAAGLVPFGKVFSVLGKGGKVVKTVLSHEELVTDATKAAESVVSKVGDDIVQIGEAASKKTGTVWDSVKATGPVHPGTVIPQSFELTLETGEKVWVDGNATKHLAEFAGSKASDYTPEAVRLASQLQLESLNAAVNTAARNGITYREVMNVNGWELIFAPPKSENQFPALYHALYKGF